MTNNNRDYIMRRVKMVKLVQKLRVLQNTKDWKAQIPAWMRILVQKKKMKFIPQLQDAKRRRVKAFMKKKLMMKGQINASLKNGQLYDRRNGYT